MSQESYTYSILPLAATVDRPTGTINENDPTVPATPTNAAPTNYPGRRMNATPIIGVPPRNAALADVQAAGLLPSALGSAEVSTAPTVEDAPRGGRFLGFSPRRSFASFRNGLSSRFRSRQPAPVAENANNTVSQTVADHAVELASNFSGLAPVLAPSLSRIQQVAAQAGIGATNAPPVNRNTNTADVICPVIPASSTANNAAPQTDVPVCRICYRDANGGDGSGGEESDSHPDALDTAELGELIMPCKCKGSSAWVHSGCLAKWRAESVTRNPEVERDICLVMTKVLGCWRRVVSNALSNCLLRT